MGHGLREAKLMGKITYSCNRAVRKGKEFKSTCCENLLLLYCEKARSKKPLMVSPSVNSGQALSNHESFRGRTSGPPFDRLRVSGPTTNLVYVYLSDQ